MRIVYILHIIFIQIYIHIDLYYSIAWTKNRIPHKNEKGGK